MADIYPIFKWMVPECQVTSPINGAIFNVSPTNIPVTVSITPNFGNISLVEFFINDGTSVVKAGETSIFPYSFTIENIENGSYSIHVRVTNEFGAITYSQNVSILVSGINSNPICEITAPVFGGGNIFAKDTDVLIRADAHDPDPFSSIAKVEFFYKLDGGESIKIGEDLISPYSIVLENLKAGTYELTAIATDEKGAKSIPEFPVIINVVNYSGNSTDNIPPITTSNISFCSSWNKKHDALVELTAVDYANTEKDVPTGIFRTYYTIDGSDPTGSQFYGPTNEGNVTKFSVLNRQGEIPIKFFSVDNLGNVERTKTDFLRLDDISPTTICSANFQPDGSNSWYKTNPTITIISNDASSGVYKISYRINNGDWIVIQNITPFSNSFSVTPFSLPSEGIYTIQFFAEDVAGNVEEIKTSFFKYDSQAPKTDNDALSVTYTEPTTIYFYTSDLYSGVDKTYYTLDGTTPTTSSTSGNSVVISKTGDYLLKYFSVDFAGNVETVKTSNIKVFIDEDKPGVYIFESFHINGKNGWYTSSPEISIAAVDSSGIKEIMYKLYPADVTTTAKYTSTKNISSTVDLSINHFIRLEIDQSGNTLEIDLKGVIPSQTTVPEIVNAINSVAGTTIAAETGSDGEEGVGYITLTSPTAGTSSPTSQIKFLFVPDADATNEVFGLDEAEYPHVFSEEVIFVGYNEPFILPSDDKWNIEFYAIDNFDNKSEVGLKTYKLDSKTPITTTINSFEPDGTYGWYVNKPEITLSASDNFSGLYKTYYRWDQRCWQEYLNDTIIEIPEEGEHYLEFYSLDNAGNEEVHNFVLYKYESVNSKPVTTDDTLNYQGVIFTTRGSGHQQIIEENPFIIDSYSFKLSKVNVVAVPYIYNVTKSQRYSLQKISGENKNEISVMPCVVDENSSRLGDFEIQLLGLGSTLLTNFDSVTRIYNVTNGIYYYVDRNNSTLDGHLFLRGYKEINIGDKLEVDYLFFGAPFSYGDVVDVSYSYDISHDPHVLNTNNYHLKNPSMQPYKLDYDVTIHLTPKSAFSNIVHTFYTTDGTIPTVNSYEGTVINLYDTGTYTIKYFSVDAAGNVEDVKTAQFNIVIDKLEPALEVNFVFDPLEDGENGWFKYNFGLKVNLWSEDRLKRINEEALEITEFKIIANQNDTIDFDEGSGEITAIIPAGTYSSTALSYVIQTALKSIGTLNYKVETIDSSVSQGVAFKISTYPPFTFKLLFATGSHSQKSIASTIGFGSTNPTNPVFATKDFPESIAPEEWSSSYTSIYYRFKLQNYFAFNVARIKTSLTNKDFTCIEILKGDKGFYDEILVYGPISLPSYVEVTQKLDIASGTSLPKRDCDYLKNCPISGSLNLFKNGVLQQLNVDYGFDEQDKKITIITNFTDSDNFVANYNLEDKILVDYLHYIGLEKVCLGLNSSDLTTEVQIFDSEDKFEGFANDRVNFVVDFPSNQSQFFLKQGINTIFAKVFDHNTVSKTGAPQKQSDIYELPFKLDTICPVTTDDITTDEWAKTRTIKLVAYDDISGSGLAKTFYTLDGLTPSRASAEGNSIILNSSGVYTLKYFSLDNAGNSEAVKTGSKQIKIDSDPPTTTMSVFPATPDGENWWYHTQPTIELFSIDAFSGVNKTFYRVNESLVFKEYTGSFDITEQGVVSVTYYSTDKAGNIEEQKTSIVKYDSIAPVTEIKNISEDGYFSSSRIDFVSADEGSGVFTTFFTTDGSDPDIHSLHGDHVDFEESGTYTLKYFSVDNAGNVEITKTQIINIDIDCPVVSEFLPLNCVITDETTEISFKVTDSLSGVDIDSILVDVDGVIYSTAKNNSYFTYTGTPYEYFVKIIKINELLNFQDVSLLKIKSVKDLAGNTAPVLEFNLSTQDTLSPWIREVYPSPNMQDVSTNSNIIAFIDDSQSGVNIKSVVITINNVDFKINSRNILKIQYTGNATSAILQIKNKSLVTFIDSIEDVSISFYDLKYNTVKKIELYLNSLPNYQATIIDARYEQKESTLLLNTDNLEILNSGIIDLYLTDENLNFSFIERGNGYLVFASPSFSFEHKSLVNVKINASDNAENVMDEFSYIFIPHIYAASSVKKRNNINRVALTYLSDIQDNIASNYSRSKSTNFYGHHKAICLELARHLEEIEHLNEDRSYSTLRPTFLYEKLGYLLQTEPVVGLSHDDYRRLLQSLISIFFKGSLKTSLEKGVSLFLGSDIKIVEVAFTEGSNISDQFVFTADIIPSSTYTGVDLFALSKNLAHIFDLVKPAHVFIIQRFVWRDSFNFQNGYTLLWQKNVFGEYVIDQFGKKVPQIASDGYQDAEIQNDTAICDRFKYEFENKYEEEIKEDCKEGLAAIKTFIEDVSMQFFGNENAFYVHRTPILKDSTHVATAVDVEVTVNNVIVPIYGVEPLTGRITLVSTPALGDVVTVSYKYNQYFKYRIVTFYLNSHDSIFGGGNNYVNIETPENEDVFIDENNQTSIQIEKRTSLITYEVIGRIVLPEVFMHAHVCDYEVSNTIQMALTYETYTGKPYPESIEEDPSIMNPDFPDNFQRMADFVEPVILSGYTKQYSPESGKQDETYFTYLNDVRFRLGAVSITNKLCKQHDYYVATWLP